MYKVLARMAEDRASWRTMTSRASIDLNRLKFVLPISSHVTITLGSFSIILLFAFMAQYYTVRNMSEKSKEVLSRDSSHDLKWV